MKKIIAALLTLLFLHQAGFAQELNRPRIFLSAAAGTYGLDVNYSSSATGEGLVLFRLSIADFYVQDEKTGFGMSFSPFVFTEDLRNRSRRRNDGYLGVSPFNAEIFWSPLKMKNSMTVGPFASVNYFVNEDDLVFKTGFKFALFTRAKTSAKFDYQVNAVKGEMGYSRINNTDNYFFSIGIDLLILLYILSL
ncbi:MAG: hypothetical protein LBQ47_01205 [Endomicrobium sp.]|jgi:hypothetical protein|nr:hypothetical protein [Endomicrobium sp.]